MMTYPPLWLEALPFELEWDPLPNYLIGSSNSFEWRKIIFKMITSKGIRHAMTYTLHERSSTKLGQSSWNHSLNRGTPPRLPVFVLGLVPSFTPINRWQGLQVIPSQIVPIFARSVAPSVGPVIISPVLSQSNNLQNNFTYFSGMTNGRKITPPLGFSTPPQILNIITSERLPMPTIVFAATTPENTPSAYRASTSANPNPMISPAFIEANYEVLESLLRERRRQICNEDLRTGPEYFSEDHDEEREMEPRPEPNMEITLPLRLRSLMVRR
ncbi:hypothetical protein Tco_0882768 [Tanacetum coccineum]